MIPYHSIENNQQFTHAGGNDHLVSFTFLFKAYGKCAYDWIKTTGSKCSHVKHAANIFSTTEDMRFAIVFSRRSIPGGQSSQGGNFLSVEFAQFRQICDEHCGSLRSHTWRTLEDTVFSFEIIIGIDIFSDELVDFINLKIESFDHFLNALFDFRVMDHKQTVGFLCSQIIELAASSDEFGQFIRLGCSVGFRGGFNDLSKFGQNGCIDGVGLCPLPHSLGKVTHLSRIDHYDRQRGIEQFGSNRTFIAASCFENNKSDGMLFEGLAKLTMTFGCVGQTVFDEVWAGSDMERVFRNIDTDINWFGHGFFPYLQIRARGLPAAQTAVRACPTEATRITLCDGLEDLDTTDLSSPAGASSARFARLASTSFTYETIINHG